MINNIFKVPLSKPTYEIFDETKYDYYPFGIYKADVKLIFFIFKNN